MSMYLTEASNLANIDRQIEDDCQNISPAQYEIIRQVIYHTGEFGYSSSIKFSETPLAKGFAALKHGVPIVVDVPEIQVGIVPKLKQTFNNAVYCCATTGKQSDNSKTRAAYGLEMLASDRSDGIFIIGQDRTALNTLVELIKNKIISPSLIVATPPSLSKQEAEEYLQDTLIPAIYLNTSKGNAVVASSIFNALVNLAWRVDN